MMLITTEHHHRINVVVGQNLVVIRSAIRSAKAPRVAFATGAARGNDRFEFYVWQACQCGKMGPTRDVTGAGDGYAQVWSLRGGGLTYNYLAGGLESARAILTYF